MSRSNVVFLRNASFVVGLAIVCTFGTIAIKRVTTVDPLSSFRGEKPKETDSGVVMTNFDWKAYKGSTLIAAAHVAKADVSQDRDTINLTTVTKGQFFDSGKVAFGFEAQNAVYYSGIDALKGSGKTRVHNDQMDLGTTEFSYEPQTKSLVVPKLVSGKLQGGDLKANMMTYKLETKSFELKGVLWSGMVAQDNTKRMWNFGPQKKGETVDVKTRGPVSTYSKFKATDGEVIVMADGGDYNKDTDVLHVKGHVSYFGPDANLTCNEATLYRKEKRIVTDGAVDMLVKPKQDGKPKEVQIPPVIPVVPEKIMSERPEPPSQDSRTDQEKQLRSGDNIHDYPITVTASRIEYWYAKGKKRAVITGSPQARQEFPDGSWRMVWAHSAVYDGEKETLDLKSKGDDPMVRMLNSLEEDMRAVSVLVSTKEGDDMMDASGVSMDIPINDEDMPEKIKPSEKKGGDKPPPISGPIGRGR